MLKKYCNYISVVSKDSLWFKTYIVILGVFVWAESHESVDYNNWASSQPDDSGNAEDCVHISGTNDHQFGWNDLECDRADAFDLPVHAVCQFNS